MHLTSKTEESVKGKFFSPKRVLKIQMWKIFVLFACLIIHPQMELGKNL